jgi:phage tail protein X
VNALTTYKTVLGDTWDNISYNQYGSSKFIKELMEANKKHIGTVIFASGVQIMTPELIEVEVNNDLPPWRR